MNVTQSEKNAPAVIQLASWLRPAARFAWLMFFSAALTLVYSGIPIRMQQIISTADFRILQELGLSLETYATYVLTLNLTVMLAHIFIAAIIFWRRPDDWMALFVSLALVANGSMLPFASFLITLDMSPVVLLIVQIITFMGLETGILLLYLFPNGRFVPGWTRGLTFLWVFLGIPVVFFPDSPLSVHTFPVPLQLAVLVFAAFTGIFAQAYRYLHVSSVMQRQQTKWATFGLMAAVIGPFAYFLPSMMSPALGEQLAPNMLYQRLGSEFFILAFVLRLAGQTIFQLGLLLFPLSFAVAILRYRLWDIDLLINRAMVYGALTGALALTYFSSILLLQAALRPLTGGSSSALVTVISTLVITAMFSPLRRRIQSSIDRRFYRRKYDAQKMLAAFSESLRDEVDLNALSDRLVGVVREAMLPQHVSLWLIFPEESSERANTI